MSKQLVFNQTKYFSAMCYYLNHIKLDLSLNRQDSLRSNVDHIAAMMGGYTTTGKTYKGDWGKFKISCYASKAAIEKIECKGWSTRGAGVKMEHVVPIKKIGDELLKKHADEKRHLTCKEILNVLQDLLIPCLITDAEDKLFTKAQNQSKSNLMNSMPNGWVYSSGINNQWARYEATQSYTNSSQNLLSDIVAIKPPTWMHKPGFPQTTSQTPVLHPPFSPTTPTPSYDCINLSNTGLSSNCMATIDR